MELKDNLEISLRQFCRLLLADRLFGDEIARIAAAAAQPVEGDDIVSGRRVQAFRRLLKIWRDLHASNLPQKPFTDAALLRGLGPPPPDNQIAMLLLDVLEFDVPEVDAILGPDVAPARELAAEGRAKYASAATGVVVIVEDEPAIAIDLEMIVNSLGATVAAATSSAESGVELILKHKPDAVLLDYNLDGAGTGLDVFNDIRDEHDCTVVFVTAHPQKLLMGGSAEPDIVIPKPYTERGMRAVLAHSLSVPRHGVVHE